MSSMERFTIVLFLAFIILQSIFIWLLSDILGIYYNNLFVVIFVVVIFIFVDSLAVKTFFRIRENVRRSSVICRQNMKEN